MTTVAFDGKILATDSRGIGFYVHDNVKKLFEIDGVSYGFSGRHTEIAGVMEWLRSGGVNCDKPEIKEEIYGIEVSDKGVFYWEKNLVRIPFHTPCAIGSGAIIAMTAMLCGKTATEAVEVAKILDDGTGGDVKSIEIVI